METLKDELQLVAEKKSELECRLQQSVRERDSLNAALEEASDRIHSLERHAREQETKLQVTQNISYKTRFVVFTVWSDCGGSKVPLYCIINHTPDRKEADSFERGYDQAVLLICYLFILAIAAPFRTYFSHPTPRHTYSLCEVLEFIL